MTTAYLLKQAGLRVALVELGRVGGGTTGHTTAKLTVGHSLVYADLTSRYARRGRPPVRAVDQQAIEQMEAIAEAESIDCDWERATNSSTRRTGIGE